MNEKVVKKGAWAGKVPIEEGFYKIPETDDEKPILIGSRCAKCGEVYFPTTPQCKKCYTETTEDIELNRVGKVYSSTIVHLAPPLYEGAVPYMIGFVELDNNGVLIPTKFTSERDTPLSIGTDVELLLETLGKDSDGNDIIVHSFAPVE